MCDFWPKSSKVSLIIHWATLQSMKGNKRKDGRLSVLSFCLDCPWEPAFPVNPDPERVSRKEPRLLSSCPATRLPLPLREKSPLETGPDRDLNTIQLSAALSTQPAPPRAGGGPRLSLRRLVCWRLNTQ